MTFLFFIKNHVLIFLNIDFLITILIRIIGITLRFLQSIITFFFAETTSDLMY